MRAIRSAMFPMESRYPRFLNNPLNQTHDLMALRSDRHKEKDVDRLGLYPRNELGYRFFDQGCRIVDIAEAVTGFSESEWSGWLEFILILQFREFLEILLLVF